MPGVRQAQDTNKDIKRTIKMGRDPLFMNSKPGTYALILQCQLKGKAQIGRWGMLEIVPKECKEDVSLF